MNKFLLTLGCFILVGCSTVQTQPYASHHESRTVASTPLTAAITAELSTGMVSDLNANIVIKSSADPASWVIERWEACSSYPCNPKDHVKTSVVSPVVVKDLRATDGDLEIKLSDEMTLIFKNRGMVPGPRTSQTDYSLLFGAAGQQKEYPIYLRASISTGSR